MSESSTMDVNTILDISEERLDTIKELQREKMEGKDKIKELQRENRLLKNER